MNLSRPINGLVYDDNIDNFRYSMSYTIIIIVIKIEFPSE